MLECNATLSSAMQYANAGKVDEWTHAYLLSDGHNKAFSDGLKFFDRYWIGSITMLLSEIPRCVGLEESGRYPIPENLSSKEYIILVQFFRLNEKFSRSIHQIYKRNLNSVCTIKPLFAEWNAFLFIFTVPIIYRFSGMNMISKSNYLLNKLIAIS